MDTKDDGAPVRFSTYTIRELMDPVGKVADELFARGADWQNRGDSERARSFMKAAAKLVEARAYMRDLASAYRSPAAPVAEATHGASTPAAQPGQGGDTTTAGAAGDFTGILGRCPTRGCGHVERVADGWPMPLCPDCAKNGRALRLEPIEGSRGPLSLSALTAESSGGAARAEGAHREDREAGRAESSRAGRVDLSAHLAALKSGGSR